MEISQNRWHGVEFGIEILDIFWELSYQGLSAVRKKLCIELSHVYDFLFQDTCQNKKQFLLGLVG